MRSRPPALDLGSAQPDRGAEIDRARDVGAGLPPHQVGKPARQLAFIRLGIGAEQHVGDRQAQHMVAEKFQPLIAAAAAVLAHQGGDVGKPAFQQRRIGKAVADPLLQSAPPLFAGAWRLAPLSPPGSARVRPEPSAIR